MQAARSLLIKVGDLPAVQQLVDQQPDTILKELCERFACSSEVGFNH